jgi:Predicted xylanase/chitin deacetylase
MYHYVRDLKNSRYPGIKGLQTDLFKEQVHYLKKHYNFVTVEQVIDAFSSNKSLPEHAVLLTFDDAYADHFNTVFPILKHEGIQGAFYVPVKAVTEHTVLDVNKIHFILASTSDEKIPNLLNEIKLLLDKYREEYSLNTFDAYFNKLAIANRFDPKEVIFVKRLLQVELPEQLRNIMSNELFTKIVDIEECVFSRELYMSKDQIKCMVDCDMHIGSHGYDHYWLGSLSRDKQKFEIKKSLEFISEVGGDIDNWSICYPYGNYNEDTIELLKENGCKLGLTTEVNLASVNSLGDTIYKLPRLDVNDIPKSTNSKPNDWYL